MLWERELLLLQQHMLYGALPVFWLSLYSSAAVLLPPCVFVPQQLLLRPLLLLQQPARLWRGSLCLDGPLSVVGAPPLLLLLVLRL